jgi:primosomal protein N'
LQRLVREQIHLLDLPGIEVVGPAPSAIKRINKKYRWQLGALSRSAQRLNALARASRIAFEQARRSHQVVLKIDLDPQGMF